MKKIEECMNRDVISVNADVHLDEVCKIMGEKHIGCVIVKNEGKSVGIFTERDLLSNVIFNKVSLTSKVENYMSSPLTVISPEFDIREAARLMAQMKIRRLPVVKEGRLIGIITSSDITRAIGEDTLTVCM